MDRLFECSLLVRFFFCSPQKRNTGLDSRRCAKLQVDFLETTALLKAVEMLPVGLNNARTALLLMEVKI